MRITPSVRKISVMVQPSLVRANTP